MKQRHEYLHVLTPLAGTDAKKSQQLGNGLWSSGRQHSPQRS